VLFLNCCEGCHEILISNCPRKLSESQCKNISKHQDNAHVYPRLFGLGTWHRCPKLVGFMPGSIFPQMPIRADHGEIERFLQWRGQHSAESRWDAAGSLEGAWGSRLQLVMTSHDIRLEYALSLIYGPCFIIFWCTCSVLVGGCQWFELLQVIQPLDLHRRFFESVLPGQRPESQDGNYRKIAQLLGVCGTRRGWPWLTVAVAMPYRSLNDVLRYLFLEGSKPKMSELGYHIQRLNSSEILSTFRDVNQR